MLISELIEKLQEVQNKQGDCHVWVDNPRLGDFLIRFDVVDRWYTYGYGKDTNVCYIVLPDVE